MSFWALFVVCAVLAPSVLAGGNDTCYGSLGCFSNQFPWSYLERPVPAPQSPATIGMHFYLYTRNARDRYYVQNPSDGQWSVDGSDYDGSKTTVFLIHGYAQNGNDTVIMTMKDAILTKADVNVIVVDWAKDSFGILYYAQVVSNTRVISATVAQLLNYLIANKGASPSRTHLVGYSLGAHISGYVGKAVANIARISVLDGAQPLFEGYDARVRLNLTDAVFIDAIHTDGRPLFPLLGFGYISAIGHVDFYVNGGWNQPGCIQKLMPNISSIADLATATIDSIVHYIRCPHDRAQELFIAQMVVQNCTFWGHKTTGFYRALSVATGGLSPQIWGAACDKDMCSEMGYDSIHFPARGTFDVVTSGTAPFCRPEPKADTVMASVYA